MRDADIRFALLRYLDGGYPDYPEALVVEEVNVCRGLSRVDVMLIGERLHGFEIKSQRDTLSRLPSQLRDYGLVFEAVTLVIGLKHLTGVLDEIPSWCGVILASASGDEVALEEFRPCRHNPNRDPFSLAQLLWRDEAIEVLDRHGHLWGVKSKPKEQIWRRLAERLALQDLADEVGGTLLARGARWRSDSRAPGQGVGPRLAPAKRRRRLKRKRPRRNSSSSRKA